VVRLTAEERERLEELTRNGSSSAKRIMHARMLLMADQDHPNGRYRDAQIAAALGVHVNTVARTRCKFARQGERAAVDRKVRATPPVPAKVDGALEAQLIAICCTPAPEGRRHWTMSLLADELMKRKLIVQIRRETVRVALKKRAASRGGSSGSASRSAMRPGSWPRWRSSSTSTRCRRTMGAR
jgi:transposase